MRKSILQSVVLENFEEELVIDAPVEEVELGIEDDVAEVEAIADVADADYAEGEGNILEVEAAEATVADMEAVADTTLAELEDENWGGHDDASLVAIESLLAVVQRHTGVPTHRQAAAVAQENFDGASHTSRREKSRVAAEGIKDLAKRAYEAFKKAMKTAFDWIVKFLAETFTRLGRAEKAVRNAQEKAKSIVDDKNVGELIESPTAVISGYAHEAGPVDAALVLKTTKTLSKVLSDSHSAIEDIVGGLEVAGNVSIEDLKELVTKLPERLKTVERNVETRLAFGSDYVFVGGNKIEWEEAKVLGFKYGKLVFNKVPAKGIAPKTKVPTKAEAEAALKAIADLLKNASSSAGGIKSQQADLDKALKAIGKLVEAVGDEDKEGAGAIKKASAIIQSITRLLSSYAAMISKLSLAQAGATLAFVSTATHGKTEKQAEKKEEEDK